MPGEVTFGLNQPDNTSTTHHHKAWKKLRSSSPFGKQPMSKEDIVAHGKCLCGQYIRSRLRRAGCLNRKVTQRLRTLIDPLLTIATREIFPALNAMGEELERMHPRVYSNVARQLSRSPFGELADADAAPFLLHATAKELFRTGADISWAKVVSLFAVCAALAVDIVRQGHYDYLPRLLDGAGDVIEEDLAGWIQLERQQQQQPLATSTTTPTCDGGAPQPSKTPRSPLAVHQPSSGGGNGGGGGSWRGLVEHFRPPLDAPTGLTEMLSANWMPVAVGSCALFVIRWMGEWCWRTIAPASTASTSVDRDL